MLSVVTTALVTCAVSQEIDGTYFATCWGRREIMESYLTEQVEKKLLGGYCVAYDYQTNPDSVDFVVVCE